MSPSIAEANGAIDHASDADVQMQDSPQPALQVRRPFSATETIAAPIVPQSRSAMAPPSVPNPHGAQARIYLNKNVTPHLLDGVKYLALNRPDQPLKWLSEFLAKRSEEVEGQS